jgi:small subunit ribosomal protein S2
MAPFIFGKRGQIHIIDIRKTLAGLVIAKKLLNDVVASGKDVVFVGTKRQAQKAVEEAAAQCGMHYVSDRWLGGTLTNFRTIRSRVQRLDELEQMQTEGTLESQSKKQASRLKRELRKIKGNMEGIRKMARLPGTVVIVDGRKEYLALREARKLGITTVGIIDTDCDPDTVDVVIPANDDSIRAIGLILNELAEAVAVGKTMVTAQKEVTPRPRRARPRRTVLARANTAEAEQVTPESTPANQTTEQGPQPNTDQPEINPQQ